MYKFSKYVSVKASNVELCSNRKFYSTRYCRNCASCKTELQLKDLVAIGKNDHGDSFSNYVYSHFCDNCGKSYILNSDLKSMEKIAKVLPMKYAPIQDRGYSSKSQLEVYVGLPEFNDDRTLPRILARQRNGIRVRVDSPSWIFDSLEESFCTWIPHFWRKMDIYTLKVKPGPPYLLSQRRTIHVLLTKMKEMIGVNFEFISPYDSSVFSDYAERDELFDGLNSEFANMVDDSDADILAIYNLITYDEEPGALVNGFRLIELLLNRIIDRSIAAMRFDRSIRNDAFIRTAKQYGNDLASKLKYCVELLPEFPQEIMAKLWSIAEPNRSLNVAECYKSITRFRNSHVHAANKEPMGFQFPWEIPSLGAYTRCLMELVLVLVKLQKTILIKQQ